MKIRSAKTLVSIAAIVIFLGGAYIAYSAFGPPGGDHWNWAPQGRVYTVQRTSFPIGINGTGIITRSSNPGAVISVKDSDIKDIKVGQKVNIWVKELSTTVEGSVLSLSPQPKLVNGRRMQDVVVSINGGGNLSHGMKADAQVLLDSKPNVLVIPSAALINTKSGKKYVWMIPSALSTQASRVRPVRKYVDVGLVDSRNAEIISGLEEGQKILVPGAQD